MKVRIVANHGNEYYDQFIGHQYEAEVSSKGIYVIKDIPTIVPQIDYKGHPIGTQWTRKEVIEEVK